MLLLDYLIQSKEVFMKVFQPQIRTALAAYVDESKAEAARSYNDSSNDNITTYLDRCLCLVYCLPAVTNFGAAEQLGVPASRGAFL